MQDVTMGWWHDGQMNTVICVPEYEFYIVCRTFFFFFFACKGVLQHFSGTSQGEKHVQKEPRPLQDAQHTKSRATMIEILIPVFKLRCQFFARTALL